MAVEYGVAPLELGLTREFSSFCANLEFDDLPIAVIQEAKRGILDWMGCAIAASDNPRIGKFIETLSEFSSKTGASVIGQKGEFGPLEAALVNGQMGHFYDYDDTHMGGVVLHTSSPVLAAILGLGENKQKTGQEIILAYIIGFEAGVRVGQTAPSHHDGGWHLTGTLGTIAAGVASASLLKLDAEQTTFALGLSATQAAGMQQNRGTMSKSFHAGRAASNGILAALMASSGYDSSDEIVEGRKGFSKIYSKTQNYDFLTKNLGRDWTILTNGYKPYACGIVQHPLIDAMIKASKNTNIPHSEIESVDALIHPHTITITGVEDPKTGLKSKFSLKHSAAVGYIDRHAGLSQYSDARAVAADVASLRQKINPVPKDDFRKDQCEVHVKYKNGNTEIVRIEHALGTTKNPVSSDFLVEKFLANTGGKPLSAEPEAIVDMIWNLESLSDVGNLMRLAKGA
ncbi:MAG: MmgE/PrpD family protein [Proteobacteria bacterium]|jgi:2-methylcitrate dehydratase PrpD|nr:MmgE/PrpD family protein [Pseudomonadota bacterium]MDA0960616.1 MmgE/PrpD family protein [Pseudomonadota bacterium]MDA1151670.1 MmgE/PrpD family protein [Pseudomonadota bacterium]